MTLRRLVFRDTSEFFATDLEPGDEFSVGKGTFVGVGGIAIDAQSQRIVSVATPTTGTDAANKAYVDAAVVGIDWKPSVRVITTEDFSTYTAAGSGVGKTLTSADDNVAHNTQDGVLLLVGDSVLVATAGGDYLTANLSNGPYVVTTLANGAGQGLVLTRRGDADQNAEVTAGLAAFVTEGTLYADTGWVLITNDAITVDTTALQFTEFTGLGSIIAGKGLLKTGAQLDVELDTGANAQGAGNGGGNSGLEFDVSGVGGKLRAAVHPTGGLDRSASGLELRLNGTTLQTAAGGASVKGLPLSFEINGVGVSSSFTAANATALVNGSIDDSLHVHEDLVLSRATGANFAKGVAGYYSANDVLSPGDCTVDAKSRVMGIANAAIASPAAGTFKKSGVVTGVLSGATFGTRYYMSSTGTPILAGSIPVSGRTIQMGIAKNATDLDVQIFDYGKRAAA